MHKHKYKHVRKNSFKHESGDQMNYRAATEVKSRNQKQLVPPEANDVSIPPLELGSWNIQKIPSSRSCYVNFCQEPLSSCQRSLHFLIITFPALW